MRWGIIVVIAGIALWVYVFNTLASSNSDSAHATPAATASRTAAAAAASATATVAARETYEVVAGDSFARIAQRFNVTVEQLAAANPGITDPTRIAVGQRIVIPR